MIKGACLIGQSGGPTAVINSSLAGVVMTALNNSNITNVYGALHGIQGVLDEQFIDFSLEDINEIELLKYTPSSALGSVRFFLEDFEKNSAVYEELLKVFKKYNIRYFFYIGGNDSMDSCMKINKYFKAVGYDCIVNGIPKTIDNDLCLTDHTPGYGSACKYIATTISEIYLDISAYKKGRVTIVEIMGRDAGWLTAASKIASINGCNPDLIYLPESTFDLNEFLADVKNIYEEKKKVFVIVGEGIRDSKGEYILNYRNYNNNDSFGHLQLGGVASVLCEHVQNTFGFPVRAIELNLPQRCAAHLASNTDIEEAFMCGKAGVEYATQNITGQMITIERLETSTRFGYVPLEDVAAKVKEMPKEFINEKGNHITDKYLEYVLPLIQGETKLKYENGLPRFARLKKILVNKK